MAQPSIDIDEVQLHAMYIIVKAGDMMGVILRHDIQSLSISLQWGEYISRVMRVRMIIRRSEMEQLRPIVGVLMVDSAEICSYR